MTARPVEVMAWVPEIPGWNLPDPDEMSWQDQALCAQTDPEAFFPEEGGSTQEAKRVCWGCEVRAECLEYALATDERFGVWGGLSERERARVKRTGSVPVGPPSCPAGHLKAPGNVYADGSCRACKNDRAREAREAARQAPGFARVRTVEPRDAIGRFARADGSPQSGRSLAA